MLSKPGEARKSSGTPSQRRRKVVEENSDDVVRRLQRLPPNKACADCSSKLTQCVNLTHGTFVCMACSGVHREFNHKIKGMGHSSFTPEEVSMLRHASSGNEAVNSRYLARHAPSDNRMKPPKNNTDLQHLRSWIQQKYIDKNWCEDDGDGGKGGGGGGSSRGGSSSSSKSKSSNNGRSGGVGGSGGGGGGGSSSSSSGPKSKSETTRRKIMPKVNRAKPAPAAPAADPFGFDSIASNSAVVVADDDDASWDAFGGSAARSGGGGAAGGFRADFGNMGAAAAPPAAAPPPPAAPAAFQPDFGNFQQQQQQQPTMVSMPPAGRPVQKPPQRPQQMQMQTQQPTAFRANFNQAPAQQQQQANQMQGGFGDFSSMNQQQPRMQQARQTVQNNQQGGFANFGSTQPQQQQQQQPNQTQMGQTRNNMQPTQGGMPSNMGMQQGNMQGGTNNFGQFPQQQQPPPPQMQQQQQQPQMQQQSSDLSNGAQSSGFGDFSSMQQQPQQNRVPQQQQMQQQPSVPRGAMGGGANPTGSTPQQQTMARPPQPPGQPPQQPPPQPPQNGTMNRQTSFASSGGERPAIVSNAAEAEPPAPSSGRMQNGSEHSGAPLNPNAFRSTDEDKKDAFDAFDGLSVEPAPAFDAGAANNAGAPGPSAAGGKSKDLNFTKYREGQQVLYSNGEGSCSAVISKVHYDDALHPFYTINSNGRERQTDDAHLSVPDASNQNAVAAADPNANPAVPGSENNVMLLQETACMLQQLNSQQLMQVKQFIVNMVSGNNPTAHASSGQNPQMNKMPANQQQKQTSFGSMNSGSSLGIDLPSAPMGGAPPSAPAAAPGQFSMQPQPNGGMPTPTMGMGMNAAPPAGAAPPPPSANQGMPQQSMMGMGAQAMPPSCQFSMQQRPTQGTPHQAMGTGTMNNAAAPTQPVAPTPAQYSMNGAPQMGMGISAPAANNGAAPMPPAAPSPAQYSMNGAPQQPMGMGMTAPAAPSPVPLAPALPPVEKEGNPFDFY